MKPWYSYVFPVVCLLGAIALMVLEKEGWGWLLFIAVIAS